MRNKTTTTTRRSVLRGRPTLLQHEGGGLGVGVLFEEDAKNYAGVDGMFSADEDVVPDKPGSAKVFSFFEICWLL